MIPHIDVVYAMDELTPRQAEILAWLRHHQDQSGLPPTRAELARAFGFRSLRSAEEHLQALARKGAIEMLPGTARGIRLPDSGLPLIGRVAAGSPILAEQNVEARLPLPATLFHPRADYLLRVRGMSMREAGILDGDLIAVHRTSEARSGQIVVARLGDEVTVKRLRRRGHQVELLPANPEFAPITRDLRRDALAIEGVFVGLLRLG